MFTEKELSILTQLKDEGYLDSDLFEITEDDSSVYKDVYDKISSEISLETHDNYMVIDTYEDKEIVVLFNNTGLEDYFEENLLKDMTELELFDIVKSYTNNYQDLLSEWKIDKQEIGDYSVFQIKKSANKVNASILSEDIMQKIAAGSGIGPSELKNKGSEEFVVYPTDLKQGEYYIALEPAPTETAPEVEDVETGENTPTPTKQTDDNVEEVSVEKKVETPEKEVSVEKKVETEASKKRASSDLPEDVLSSYIETALWSSRDSYDDDGSFLDQNYSIDDLAPEALERAKKDTSVFLEKAEKIVSEIDPEYELDQGLAGHDFWLTRNGHGAGFWDGDYPKEIGDALTELSREFGEIDLIVGEDNKLYFEGGKDIEASKKESIQSPVKTHEDYGDIPFSAKDRQKKGSIPETDLNAYVYSGETVGVTLGSGDSYQGVLESNGNGSYAVFSDNEAFVDGKEPVSPNFSKEDVINISRIKDYSKKTSYMGYEGPEVALEAPQANPVTVDEPGNGDTSEELEEELITSFGRFKEDTKTADYDEEDEEDNDEEEKEYPYELIMYTPEPSESEDEEFDEDFFENEPYYDDAITINEDEMTAFYGGKPIAKSKDWDELATQIKEWMDKENYWPSIYVQHERGDMDPYIIQKKGAMDNFEVESETNYISDEQGMVGSHTTSMSNLLASIETLSSMPGGEGDDGSAYDLAEDHNFSGVDEEMVTVTVDEYLAGKATSLASFEEFEGYVSDVYGIEKTSSMEDAWYNDDSQELVSYIKENATRDLFK